MIIKSCMVLLCYNHYYILCIEGMFGVTPNPLSKCLMVIMIKYVIQGLTIRQRESDWSYPRIHANLSEGE